MKSSEGGLWTLTLFAANEIPSVVVTFVAVIMFLQMGLGTGMSTLYASALLLPWVGQPLMRKFMYGALGGRLWLHVAEMSLTVLLAFFALTMGTGKWCTLALLAGVSLLSAWHDLLARCYYERRTMYAQGNAHGILRALSSQMSTVLTYGLMIMAVGVLQIYFRNRPITYSWALGCYILTGVYMVLALMNLLLLRGNRNPHTVERRHWPWRTPGWGRQTMALMLMLLPQGLMFYGRTVYLLARPQQGGLGCTLQEVGFAHGTIGVIAFLVGVAAGRALQHRYGEGNLKWPLTLCLGLSPAVYMAMTQWEPQGLWPLSAYTFMAQMLFGLGLNACRRYIENISGERYRKSVNPLYIPIISLCILMPMALSGFMLEKMTFEMFFLVDALCAVLMWGVVWMGTLRRRDRTTPYI